nr:MAG TPA: tail assembly chaperone protein [Bacteriophage sp.]
MKFYEIELNGETLKFRLTSNDCMVIEKKSGKSIMDYIQNLSVTTIISLLMYMRRSDVPNFSEKDAGMLYDQLIDNGWTIAKIVNDIILEALAVSGFMSKEDLTEIKTSKK